MERVHLRLQVGGGGPGERGRAEDAAGEAGARVGGGAVGAQRGEPCGLLRDGRRPVGAAQSAAAQATALLGGGQRREEEQEQGSGLHRAQDCEERDPRLNKQFK